MLARQALFYLSQTPSLSYFSYFGDKVSFFAWAGLDNDGPIYAFYIAGMTMPSHWLRWDLMIFLSGLALKHHPPDLYFLSS
jgi:hypothetical protein